MTAGFEYSYSFQKENDGKDYWLFTTSGNPDDPNNLNASELEVLIRWASLNHPKSEWINSIVGIGLGLSGLIAFHFSDGSVSFANAYTGECYEFLDALGLFAIGYVMSIAKQETRPVEWLPLASDLSI